MLNDGRTKVGHRERECEGPSLGSPESAGEAKRNPRLTRALERLRLLGREEGQEKDKLEEGRTG